MNLDFSFLSQDKELDGVLTPAAINAEARASKTAEQFAQNHQAPPLVLELRGARTSQEVPDSWTLWDSNRQANGAGGVPQHPIELAPHGGPNAVPEGSTSFSRAFAHMKQRPGYEPPKPAQRPQDSIQGTHAAGSKAPNARAIQVSRRQTNNPLLRSIRNVPWEYAEIVPDYQMGAQTCCLFLSLRYHLLKPNYIYTRMDGLQRGFRLRVLLCLVDAEDNTKTLIDIHKVTVVNGWTLILAWSPEEAARYLETYQALHCFCFVLIIASIERRSRILWP
jgi:DNA repair protein Rad10